MRTRIRIRAYKGRAVLALLALPVMFAVISCGGSGASGSSSPSALATTPSPSPTSTAESWQPGVDSRAATAVVARKWMTMLRSERFADSELWSEQATFDLWASDSHESGGAAVKGIYVGAAPDSAWTASHSLVSPGAVAYEVLYAQGDLKPTAALDLLAVSAGKVIHEDIYLDLSGGRGAEPVTQWPSSPAPTDTVARTTRTATAFVDAVTESGTLKLGRLLDDDVLFYDTAQKRQQRGATALLRWWGSRAAATLEPKSDQGLIVGPGWAAVRWTATGGQTSTEGITMPGVALLEIRSGKVVRMTLYYDSATLALHM
jgi:hypothetical protein